MIHLLYGQDDGIKCEAKKHKWDRNMSLTIRLYRIKPLPVYFVGTDRLFTERRRCQTSSRLERVRMLPFLLLHLIIPLLLSPLSSVYISIYPPSLLFSFFLILPSLCSLITLLKKGREHTVYLVFLHSSVRR